MNLELFRLAKGSDKARTIRWNNEGGFLELVGSPTRADTVTSGELRHYVGWLLGTFVAGKKMGQQSPIDTQFCEPVGGTVPLLQRWQGVWSDLSFRAKRSMCSFGLLGEPSSFQAEVRKSSVGGSMEPRVVTAWREGHVQAALWVDNFTRYKGLSAPSAVDGSTLVKNDYSVACLMAVPHSTNTIQHSVIAHPTGSRALGLNSFIHEDLFSARSLKYILNTMEEVGAVAGEAWQFVWEHVSQKQTLTEKQREQVGDRPCLHLLPQLYRDVEGSEEPVPVWNLFNSTFPVEAMSWGCGTVQGKLLMLEYINNIYRVFAARDQCLVLVLDWDTWRTVMRAVCDKHGRGRHLAKNLILHLDHFHMLKYLTHSTVELLNPIRTLLMGLMQADRQELDNDVQVQVGRRAAKSLKGQQFFVSVLFMAYLEVRGVCGEAIIANRTSDPFMRYLYDVFEVALPLCVGAWVAYRKGKRYRFGRSLFGAIPLLFCMHHPQYATGIMVSSGFELACNFGLSDWYKDQFPTFSAELCEMTLKPLSRRVARNDTVLQDPTTVSKMYVWEHHRNRCRDLFRSAWRKPTSTSWKVLVGASDPCVVRVASWLRDLLLVCAKHPGRLSLPTRLHNYPGWTAMNKQVMAKVEAKVTRWFGDKLPGEFANNTDIPDFFVPDHDPELARAWRAHAKVGSSSGLKWQTVSNNFVEGMEEEEEDLGYFKDYVKEYSLPREKFCVKDLNLWTGDMVLDTSSEDLKDMKISERLSHTIDVDYGEWSDSSSSGGSSSSSYTSSDSDGD